MSNFFKFLIVTVFSFLMVMEGKSEEIIREDLLMATTSSPQEGEIQYVGISYINGGTWDIVLSKTQKTTGSIKVDYTKSTKMDDGSKRKIEISDTWVWDPEEISSKSDSGVLWLNTQYQENEIGSHTWNTEVYWEEFEFTGTGWKYIGGGKTFDTNNYTVATTGGCS